MVVEIGKHLESGDSISVARKKVCGNNFSSLKKAKIMRRIVTHPVYVQNLNAYLVKIKKPFQYRIAGDSLVCRGAK